MVYCIYTATDSIYISTNRGKKQMELNFTGQLFWKKIVLLSFDFFFFYTFAFLEFGTFFMHMSQTTTTQMWGFTGSRCVGV